MGYLTRSHILLWITAIFLTCWIPAVTASSDSIGLAESPVTEEPTLLPPVTEPTSVGCGKGWIDTYCNIDGATVYFDGSAKGKVAGGALSVAVSPTGTPVQTVKVTKSGYVSWSGSLSHMPADGEHVAVYATLNPVPTTATTPIPPQTGAIYAQSSPGGAAIYVNGIFYGYSPLTIPGLQPNTYSVKAVLSGYTTDSRIVTVYSGQTAPYYPQLQPSPPAPRDTGTVVIKSSPAGAQAYFDGEYRGVTPLTLSLYTGGHTVLIRQSGYNDWSTTVTVSAGSTQTVYPALSSATTGMITIGSAPAGAQVYLDSNLMGVTDSTGTVVTNSVGSGNHLVKVTANGYDDWIETIYVKPNTNNYVAVSMTRSGSAPVTATGSLNIVSSPAGADVSIDNIFRGSTPPP